MTGATPALRALAAAARRRSGGRGALAAASRGRAPGERAARVARRRGPAGRERGAGRGARCALAPGADGGGAPAPAPAPGGGAGPAQLTREEKKAAIEAELKELEKKFMPTFMPGDEHWWKAFGFKVAGGQKISEQKKRDYGYGTPSGPCERARAREPRARPPLPAPSSPPAFRKADHA